MHARKNCVTAAVTFSSLTFLTLRERPESGTHTKLWSFSKRTRSALIYCIDTLILSCIKGTGETKGGVPLLSRRLRSLDLTQLWPEYHELLLSLFWQKDRSNSHLALRERYLLHRTRKETIKKMHLTVGSIHMQYNVSSPSD